MRSRVVRERIEFYGSLRTSVLMAAESRGARTLLLVDTAGETQSGPLLCNLGLSLAAVGKRVLLLEANLRRPELSSILAVPPATGLTNILAGETTARNAVVQVGTDGLGLIGSGPLTANPADVLGSSAMRNLLLQLQSEVDLVLIDAPSILSAADAISLAPIVDGIVLIGALGRTSGSDLTEARRLFDQVGARILGGVLLDESPFRASSLISGKLRRGRDLLYPIESTGVGKDRRPQARRIGSERDEPRFPTNGRKRDASPDVDPARPPH
jgi:capsular exopolysaccharide synthesis family protein